LEKFQIAFYQSQLSSTKDRFYYKAFRKIVYTEKKHAGFFAKKLAESDIQIPQVGGTLAELGGSIIGESVEITGPVNTCKIGVALENKTLSAYHKLIDDVREEPGFRDKLLEFLLEEEFHALWLQDYAKRLKERERNTQLPGKHIDEHPSINVNMRWI